LAPHYRPGESLLYEISMRSVRQSLVSGALANPQGARQLELSVSLRLRLDVLSTISAGNAPSQPAPSEVGDSGTGRLPLRLRATYERASATASGDTYDPTVAQLEDQYRHLQGHSIEFQIGPNGDVQYLRGMEDTFNDPRFLAGLSTWLQQLAAGEGAAPASAHAGSTWQHSEAVPNAPLAGTVLEMNTSYLRDEPCSPADPSAGECAVLLSRFSVAQKSSGKDATPESYRKEGLKTSGHSASHGETLVYISLRTGCTVSVTQSGDEEMDLTILHNDGGPPLRYASRAKTETRILLLPSSSP
jgi:hypothetical protein